MTIVKHGLSKLSLKEVQKAILEKPQSYTRGHHVFTDSMYKEKGRLRWIITDKYINDKRVIIVTSYINCTIVDTTKYHILHLYDLCLYEHINL